jgi:hypothetical protein
MSRMRTTGNPLLQSAAFRILGFLLLVWTSLIGIGQAQDLSVTATLSETQIFQGERFGLSIEISGSDFSNIERPQLPDIKGARLLSGTPSVSRNYQFINGKSTRSFTYTYFFSAEEAGRYQLPEIPVIVDNKTYRTQPVDYRILARDQSGQQKDDQRANLFMRLEVSDTNPVAGQQLLANVVLYFKENVEIISYQPEPGWKAEGFWKEQLNRNDRPMAESVIMNGERYRKARLMQYALFPTRSGDLTLSPYTVTVSVRVRSNRSQNDPFSSFFGGFGTNRRDIDLKSKPVNMSVRNIPEISDAEYIGAVGRFNIKREISTTSPREGETIELTTTIEGTGNVPLVSKPQYDLPEAFERYQPKEQSNIDREGNQIVGRRTFTDILVARKAGSYTIPATTVAFYDAGNKKFDNVRLGSYQVNVRPALNAGIAASNNGIPLQPITGIASWQSTHEAPLTSYWWFWAGSVLPFLILGVGFWQKQYQERLQSDSAFARSEKAKKAAQKQLQQAQEHAETNRIKETYGAMQKALAGFISDRLNLPGAGLDKQTYLQHLRDQQLDAELIKKVDRLMDKAGTIQYAPNASVEDAKSDIETTRELITTLSKHI